MSQPYILIRNGLIIDGTGSEPFAGDVLIQNNRIVASRFPFILERFSEVTQVCHFSN